MDAERPGANGNHSVECAFLKDDDRRGLDGVGPLMHTPTTSSAAPRATCTPTAPSSCRHRPLAVVALLALAALTISACDTVKSSVDSTVDAITPRERPSGPRDVDVLNREPDIRVRIARQGQSQNVAGPEKFVLRPTSGTATSPAHSARAVPGPLTITSSEKGVRTIDGSGQTLDWGFSVDLDVLASDGTPDGAAEAPGESIRLDGRLIPGFLTFRPRWGDNASRFDIIATMPIESYLPGVLSKELYKDWPRQTFEAQAVAARTYALQERQRARSEAKVSDVEDSTADQVFGGTGTLMVAVEAAHATRGWTLTDQGRLIRAYFSSQCGGRPASAAEVWSVRSIPLFNQIDILQGKPRQTYCQRSPLYRWTVTRTADDFNKRLRAWGRAKGNELGQLSRVRSIEPKTRNEANRPTRYTITGDNGREYAVAAEELREACNWPVEGLAPITRENRLHSGDVEISIYANDVRVLGRGFGHGVGMCQWCAKGMAESGMDWRSMVEQFYPGVDVRKLY